MKFIDIDHDINTQKIKQQLDKNSITKVPELAELDDIQLSLGLEVDDKIVSRLTGDISFNALNIHLFASEASSRGKGYGTKLFKHVEKLAIEKGCHYIFLETMSFDAPQFYLKQGFEIIKKVENSPVSGESHYFMYKDIR